MKLLIINTVQYKRNIKMMSTSNHIPHQKINQHHSQYSHPQSKQQIRYSCSKFSVLQVDASKIIHCLDVYSWRFKTYLPIVKTTHYGLNCFQGGEVENEEKMVNRFHSIFEKLGPPEEVRQKQGLNYIKNHPQMKTYELFVTIETIKFQLTHIHPLPLPQILYLLKEMMVGYEVLVDIFGMFDPHDSMIMVNTQDQWKIWISHLLQSTEIHHINITEKQFIYRLVVIAQNHCIATSLSNKFFMEVKSLTYQQDCTFVKVLQKIKQFASINKILNVNKVVFQGNYSPARTLTKKKGYYRFQQMKSSLVEGKYIPKQHINSNSQYLSSQSQISPQKKIQSLRNNQTPGLLDCNNTSNKEWNDYQLYTPRQRTNTTFIHTYSPQVQIQTESNYFNKKMVNSLPNTLLNNTISNSIIQKRRKSDQTSTNFNQKYKVTNQNQSLMYSKPDIIRQIKYHNQPASKQPLNFCKNSKMINNNDSLSLISTQKLKDSIRTDNPCTPNYSHLKKNDMGFYSKNLQNSYLNFSIHNHKEDKSLTVSQHFGTNDKQDANQKESSQKSSQIFLKNTISGLFSNSAPIRQLKTSIKVRSPEQIQEQQKYLSDINLQLLSKMGRHAKGSFIKQEQSSTAGHIQQNTQSAQVKDEIKCINSNSMKDSQQESTLSKAIKPKNAIVIGKNCVFLLKNTSLKVGQ